MEPLSRRGFAAAFGGALLVAVADQVAPAAASAAAPTAVTVRVDGQVVKLADPPLVAGGKVYLSAVDIGELLGVPVTWDARARVLDLGSSEAAPPRAFVFQGVAYGAASLQIRTYPGAQNTVGSYWIVEYTATNQSAQPVALSASGGSSTSSGSGAAGQPPLMLIGPNGSESAPDPNLSGPQPGSLNPGVTFSSYLVFDMPAGALPHAYVLGFNAYRVTSSGFTTTRLSTPLPAPSQRTESQTINATYALSGLWNAEVQEVLIRAVVRTNAIVPELQPADFDPSGSFWIVEFGIDNPGPGSIAFGASDFALRFNGSLSIAPTAVGALPGYVPANDLQSGVTLAGGQVFNGALLFAVPGGTLTTNPQFVLQVNGVERAVPVAPCLNGVCPPAQA